MLVGSLYAPGGANGATTSAAASVVFIRSEVVTARPYWFDAVSGSCACHACSTW